ncbi:MAG: hypothetical protein ABJP34_13435 [Erythrobacter sp.]
MKRTKQLLGAVSAVALVGLSASPALAAGTTAGDSITNNVSVAYQVGGVDQTEETASDTFVVDRKVDVTVAEVGGASTSVSPGETQAALTFDVTNNTNDVVDLDLSDVQDPGNDFVLTNVEYYLDDGDGVFGPGDTLITFLDEMAEDETRTVHVVGDVPIGASNGDTADVALIADAHTGGGAGTLGAELTDTAGANTAGVDTVLADLAGDEDLANEGDHSDTDTYVVGAADITVAKSSSVVSDPVNGTSNPKAIPGATIEYCITVANAAGAATATGVNVNDVLPADVTYDAGFGIFVDGNASCASGVAGGSYNAADNEVDGALSDIAASTTRSLYFRVTID